MITDTCRYAWNSTKKSTQPDYDDLIQSYRDMLTARAEAVKATGMADDGPFAAFENAVLNAPPEPSASSDQGYEQVVDAEPIVNDADQSVAAIAHVEPPTFDLEKEEAARLERKRRRDEAQPKKPKVEASPSKKSPKKPVVKKAAKKKPVVIKKGKK